MHHLSLLISHIFRVQYCLCFISDDSLASGYIQRILLSKEIPMASWKLDGPHEALACEAYLITSDNFTSLLGLFARGRRFDFGPHRRLAIFYNAEADFLSLPFLLGTGQDAIDMFVVQNFLDGDSESKIKVTDVYKRKVKVLSELGQNDFAPRLWLPDFSVRDDLKFRVAAFNCSPYVLVDENNRVYGGVGHKIIQEIAKGWPFEYRVHEYSFDKDLYLEVTNDVLNGTSDVAMCDHWMVFSMLRQSDLSYPYTQACITFLVPKPLLMPDITFVFQPITALLWGIILGWVFLAASALYVSGRCTVEDTEDFATCVLNITRLLALNTLKRFPPPGQHVQRMIITSWCIICLVLTTGYSAGFSSLLTYPRFYRHINTLQDMADAQIRWGDSNEVTRNYLASNPHVGGLQIAQLFQHEDSIELRLARIKRNDYGAMVTVLPRRYLGGTAYLDDYAKTHLKVLSDCFGLYYFVFPLPKNSPYKRLLQQKIMAFLEHGFISYWYSEILAENNLRYMENFYTPYAEPIPNTHVPFGVSKVKGALFLLATGLTLAVVVFIGELVMFGHK